MKHIYKIATAAALALSFASATGYAKSEKDMEAKFKKMDTNSDNKISLEEFEEGKEEKFSSMDANKDGFLTMEEKKSAYDMKKKRRAGK